MSTVEGAPPRPAGGSATVLASWLGLALLVVGLLNGIGPFLRRVGIVERTRYEAFWEVHTGPSGFTTAPFGLGRRCVTHRPVEEGGAVIEGGGPPALYVFDVRPWEVPLKALKDLLALAVVAGALAARFRGFAAPPRPSWPLAGLAALVAAQAAAGLLGGGAAGTAAGLRSFEPLAVALAAGSVAGRLLPRLVPWLVGLLAVQVALAPIELLRGIPVQGHMALFGELFARRAAGTFVMPNTLGVFAAAVAALAATLGASRRVRACAWVAGGLAVVASGSATGLVGLGAAGAVAAGQAVRRRRAFLPVAGLAAFALAAGLALVSGRPDVVDSAASRASALGRAFSGPVRTLVVGRGLGAGTNAERQLRWLPGGEERAAGPGAGDSAVAALLAQTGLAGLACGAAALALAWARRRELRPFLAVVALSGLTLGVAEAFPLGLLLGLALGPDPVREEEPGEP